MGEDFDFTESLGDKEEVFEGEPNEKKTNRQEELLLEAKRFIDSYKKKLSASLREESLATYVDFLEIADYSPTLAEELIKNPEEALKILELAIEELGLVENSRVRLFNLPKSNEV